MQKKLKEFFGFFLYMFGNYFDISLIKPLR